MQASLILPMDYNGPAFLIYRNFHAILRWNRSILYVLFI
nr:lytic murein transglycosylase [Candidatus Vesicomyosocius okutanii]